MKHNSINKKAISLLINPKKNASSFSRIKVHCSRNCANKAVDAEIDKETQGLLWKEWREYKKMVLFT